MRLASIHSLAAIAASLGQHEGTVHCWTKERAELHRLTLEDEYTRREHLPVVERRHWSLNNLGPHEVRIRGSGTLTV